MVFIFYYLNIPVFYNNQHVTSPAEQPASFWFLQKQAFKPMWKPRSPQQYCPPARNKVCNQDHCQYRVVPFTRQVEREKAREKPFL
jgi:hypothetical protein